MPNTRTIQRSFNGGELTPEFYGQIQDPKYQSGVSICRNFVALPHGPIHNRSGLTFVRAAKNGGAKKCRLIPFSFSTTQTMVLEFGDFYVRFHTNGATLMSGGVPYEVATPYTEADIADLHYVQSADVLTIVHPNYQPRELRRMGSTSWSLDIIGFASNLAAPTGISATANLAGGTATTNYYYRVTAVDATGLEESLASSPATCYGNLLATGAYNQVNWSSVSGATRYNIYKQTNGALYGYIGQSDGVTFYDNNITADISKTPPINNNPFGTPGNYPGAVSYFEQRRCFAGTNSDPQNIWMTRSGTESNMAYSLPTRDDDSINFRVAAREANTIRHIIPLNNLVLLTSSAEWRVHSVNTDAITPSSVSVSPQSYIGASNVQPSIINNTLIYPAARGGHVREMSYSWQSGGFVTGDLSLRAPHLFDNKTIVDMAYSRAPYPIVWFVSSSGDLLGLTYVPEQQVGAWHRHDTDGKFESCCVVTEGSEDVLYVVVQRDINGVSTRYIERMASRQPTATYQHYAIRADSTAPRSFIMDRMPPIFWKVNFNSEMMGSLVTNGSGGITANLLFRTTEDLAGIEFTSVDNSSPKHSSYETNRNYAGLKLSFDYSLSGNIVPLDQNNGPVLTVEGRDRHGIPKTWYIRLWNYVTPGSTPTSGHVDLDFATLSGGWYGAGLFYPGDVDRMFISVVPGGYTPGVKTWVTESTGTITLTNMKSSGDGGLVVREAMIPPHEVRLASGYDDVYNQTPEAIVRQFIESGSSKMIDWYIGASHYYSCTWNGSALVVDPAKPKLNPPAAAWHTDFFARLHAAGFESFNAMSLEILTSNMPSAWAQRDSTGAISATGWIPSTSLISPCSTVGIQHIADAFNYVLSLQPAGMKKLIQFGEWWWWYNGYVATGYSGAPRRPCLYDANTTALYTAETGLTAPVVSDIADNWSSASAYVAWCRDKLGACTVTTKAIVSAAHPDTEFAVLLFPPGYHNVPGAHQISNQTILEVLNIPVNEWKYPNMDWCQLEDYDWVTSGKTDDMRFTYKLGTQTLGYPMSKIHYMSGYAATSDMWSSIQTALNQWAVLEPNQLFLWSQVQVAKDDIKILIDTDTTYKAEHIFMDAAVTYRGFPADVISGLGHLEGKEVSVLADGAVMPRQVVRNGSITLPVSASVIQIGIPFLSDMQTLPVTMQVDGFGMGRNKNINKAWLRVFKSGGIFIGPDEETLTEVKQRTNEAYGTAPRLKTEEIQINTVASWTDSGQVFIRQKDPLPLTLVSLTTEVALGS